MPALNFIPMADLTLLKGQIPKPGTLAFNPKSQAFDLYATWEGRPVYATLGGDNGYPIWHADDNLPALVIIEDWRIEVDVSSAVDIGRHGVDPGQAVLSKHGIGIVGLYQHSLPKGRVAVTAGGTVDILSDSAARAAFAVWRIVAGSEDRPSVLIDVMPVADA